MGFRRAAWFCIALGFVKSVFKNEWWVMKGICFQGVEKVASIELKDAAIEDDRDAIVKVSLAGLCGSDLHPYFGRESGLDPGTVMGHEMVGEIVELGSAVGDSFSIGDRVFAPFSTNCGSCFYCERGLTSRCERNQLFGWIENGVGLHGCQAQYVRVPLADATLMHVPDNVTDEQALLLTDNFSTGYYCAEMARMDMGGTCAVIGCGTVGLLAIMAAREMGAEEIFAIDLVEDRLRIAEGLGAIPVLPVECPTVIGQATDDRGVDAVMELVGLPLAQQLAYKLLRPGGIMSVVGCHCTEHFAFSPVDAFDKNLTYKTGRCPARAYMDKLTPQVAAGKFKLDMMITDRFGVDEGVKAYEVFSQRKNGSLKAVVEMT